MSTIVKYNTATRPFPPVALLGNRFYVRRSEFEEYKALVFSDASGQPVAPVERAATDSFLTLEICAKELGVSTKTLRRRIAEGKRAESAEPVDMALDKDGYVRSQWKPL